MSKGGRPSDPIHLHFIRVEVDGKEIVKCKICNEKVSAKADRMRNHFFKCGKKTTEPLAKKVCTVSDSDEESLKLQPRPSSSKTTGREIHQPQIEQYMTKTSKTEKEKIDLKMAEFFYACNIPFSVAEHPAFDSLISSLRPGYTPPNRKRLAGDLLDKINDNLKETARNQLQGKSVTLVQDGWSNLHNDPVIANCLQHGKTVVFHSAVETGSNVKSGKYCADLAREAIKQAKDMYNCSVISCVTDNEKKMQAMRSELEKDELGLVTYGCSSHWLHLLGQDLTPNNLIKHIIQLQKYFRSHHRPGAWLKECDSSVKPQLPGDTRWNSQVACLQTYVRNRPHYLKIASEHEAEIEDSIVGIINNQGIYKQAKDLLKLLQPIANALDALQGDTSTIADACDVWLKLLECDELKPHLPQVNK